MWNDETFLANFGEARHQWISYGQTDNTRYLDTLCAPMPVVGEDCGVSNLDASIKCKFKVNSTRHAGMTAYRINYNAQEPGRFDGTTFKSACRTLSQAIATQTGTDPNLKPLCNHMSTGSGYCDYDTARYTDAYLTKCSDDSSSEKKCLGLPFEAVTYAVFYNDPVWNDEAFLANFGEARHQWVSYGQTDNTRYLDTLCAPMPVVGEDCGVNGLDSSVQCKFKIQSSLHGGFTAYRVQFNTESPGSFDQMTLVRACAKFGLGLKPICNNPSHTDEWCRTFEGSYLTQCSESDSAHCAGLPFEAVTYGVYYNTIEWNGESFLANFGEKRHQWVPFKSPNARYTDTLCA